jgi:hypothetical protein
LRVQKAAQIVGRIERRMRGDLVVRMRSYRCDEHALKTLVGTPHEIAVQTPR